MPLTSDTVEMTTPTSLASWQPGDETRRPERLSVIIVNWNTCDLLAQCLQSIAAAGQSLGRGTGGEGQAADLEVIVVDNASTDGSAGMVRERFPWAHLIANQTNVGFAPANNQAFRISRGRYLMLLNSDTLVHPGAFETLLDFMEHQPQAGGCGPRLLNADGTLQVSCTPMPTPEREFWRLMFLERVKRRATYPMHRWQIAPRQVQVIKGACFLLRREALAQAGLLDESYFMYSEEVDLCHRLQQAGWQLWWVPEAVVTHYGEASSRRVAHDMYIELYRSKTRFYRKYGGHRRAERFKGLVRVAYWPRLGFCVLGARFSASLRDRALLYRRLLVELAGM